MDIYNLCKLISSAKEPPTIQQIVTNPRLLIGTRIRHRFEEEDGSLTWYEGLVIGHLSNAQTFEVVYFGEDEICEFELLEDYSKNDLKFLTRVNGATACMTLYCVCTDILFQCIACMYCECTDILCAMVCTSVNLCFHHQTCIVCIKHNCGLYGAVPVVQCWEQKERQ